MGGIIIKDGKVGANILGNEERNSALLLQAVAVVGKFELGKLYTIYSKGDANELGLDAVYDATNNARVYYHIKEFFRLSGEGTRLMLFGVARTVTMTQMVEDTTAVYAKKLLQEADAEGYPIHNLAVGLNPATGYTPTIVDGLNQDVKLAISKAKLLTIYANEQHTDVTILLEGRDLSATASTVHDFLAQNEEEHNRVAIVVAQDWAYADGLDALGKKHAAIGTALGAVASRNVNESIGWVQEMNLQDKSAGAFLVPGISSHVKSGVLGNGAGSQTETYIAKGYIIARVYPGYPGVYFGSDFTCSPQILDEDGNVNIHSISQSRTSNKLIRNLRKELMPRVQSVVRLNAETGKLDDGDVLFLQDEGNKVFERAEAAAEIVGGQTIVNPAITIDGKIEVSFRYVKTSILSEVNGTINQKIRF